MPGIQSIFMPGEGDCDEDMDCERGLVSCSTFNFCLFDLGGWTIQPFELQINLTWCLGVW